MEFEEDFGFIGQLPPLPVLDLGPAFNPDNFTPTPFGPELGGFFRAPLFCMGRDSPPPPPFVEPIHVARRLSIKAPRPKRGRVVVLPTGPNERPKIGLRTVLSAPSPSLLRRLAPPAGEMRHLLQSFETLTCLRRIPTPCDSTACECDKFAPSSCTRPRSVTFVLQ
jgi:hypothetical protein